MLCVYQVNLINTPPPCYDNGVPSDAPDEYTKAAKNTAMESMKRFVRAICVVYEKQYLRQPTREDLEKKMLIHKARGWPCMFGSIDCMRYQWKNCPVTWN